MRVDVVATSPSALAASLLRDRPPAVPPGAPAPAPPVAGPTPIETRTYDFAGRAREGADPGPGLAEAARLLEAQGETVSMEELERAQQRRGTLLDVLA